MPRTSLRFGLFAVVCAGAFCWLLTWRAWIPANRYRSELGFWTLRTQHTRYYLPRELHGYDDAVTLTTALNFARDGWTHTHALPNRRGAVRVSLYDFSGTQCETLTPASRSLVQYNGFGQRVANVAVTNDCIHIHYPPLADWIFGALASVGLVDVAIYKSLAIGLNLASLWLSWVWLRREVSALAAFLAVLLSATSPAFLEWADALYFHAFQQFFLLALLVLWRAQLHAPRRWRLALCWLVTLLQTLVSPQLVLCSGLLIAGFSWLHSGTRTGRQLLVLSTAPMAALALTFGLSLSLFGFARVRANWLATLPDRVAHLPHAGFTELFANIDQRLLPWSALGLGVAAIVLQMELDRRRRALQLLALSLLACASFTMLFPGTAAWHAGSVYRHGWFFAATVIAFAAEATLSGRRRARAAVVASLGAGCLLLAIAQNGRHLQGEIEWNLLRHRAVTAHNLVLRSLDAIYWTSGAPHYRGDVIAPVSGVPAQEPPAWSTDLRPLDEEWHYEVWWLEPVALRRVRVLLDADRARDAAGQCSLELFDGEAFRPGVTTTQIVPFVSQRVPTLHPYVWLEFAQRTSATARAVRFTCRGTKNLALRQIEAFS